MSKKCRKHVVIGLLTGMILTLLEPLPQRVAAAEDDFVIVDGVLTEYLGDDENLVIPEGVTEIGYGIFENSYLISVTIPQGVKMIAPRAFADCCFLTSVELPASLTTISTWAFDNCVSLTDINIPAKVSEIGAYAFRGTPWLEEKQKERKDHLVIVNKILIDGQKTTSSNLTIPSGVTTIGTEAFANCEKLKKVVLPKSVKKIDSAAFMNCGKLKNITIPTGVSDIKAGAFTGTPWLAAKQKERKDHLVIVNKILIDGTLAEGNITIPADVSIIGDSAFWYNTKLKKVTIKKGVKQIFSNAFCGCSEMTTVTIPASVKTIEYHAFYECAKLTVKLPKKLKGKFSDSAFESCRKITYY